MVRRACPRETRDRDPMAPSRVPQVLDLALATPAHRSALHQCWPARADPSHGCGEPDLGRSPDSRRASDAGDRRLGAYGLKVPPSSAAQSRRAQALDPVPAQPPRGDRGDGLLHRTDSNLPYPLRLVRDRSRQEAHSPLRRDGPTRSRVGYPAAARGVPSRFRHPTSHLRPRRDLLWPGGFYSGGSRPAPDADLLPKPVAERCRRALGRERAKGTARSCRGLQRAPPAPAVSRLRGVLPRPPYALRPSEADSGRPPAVAFAGTPHFYRGSPPARWSPPPIRLGGVAAGDKVLASDRSCGGGAL